MYDPLRSDYGLERSRPEHEIPELDQQIADMRRYRMKLIHEASKKQLDPTIELAVTLAHEAGEMKARYEGQFERNEKQLMTIGELKEKVEDLAEVTQSRDIWRDRAESAEATLKRSRAARRR